MSTNAGRPMDELPVLTDVIVPGHIPLPAQSVSSPGSVAAVQATNASNWATLETEVAESVLRGLQGRIESMVDRRVGDTVGLLLEEALNSLTAELKLSLRETVRDVVQRAVAQEISRLRAGKS